MVKEKNVMEMVINLAPKKMNIVSDQINIILFTKSVSIKISISYLAFLLYCVRMFCCLASGKLFPHLWKETHA